MSMFNFFFINNPSFYYKIYSFNNFSNILFSTFIAKGKSLDATQEMIALGLCNMMGSFVKSMPVTGSFTRTAVNFASGVKTPMGGIVTGSIVLLACGLLTSAFKFIPKATLAAIIIVAMYNMLELHIFFILWKTKSKSRRKFSFLFIN